MMTQSLRAFVALAKGFDLGPSIHTAAQSAGSRVSDTLASSDTEYLCGAHTHIQAKYLDI